MTEYATVTQVRSRIQKERTTSDDDILALIQAASQMIDEYCHRPDGFVAVITATARQYAGRGLPFLYIDECVAISTVEVKATADGDYVEWSSGDWLAFQGSPTEPVFETPYIGIMVSGSGDYSHFTDGQHSGLTGFRVRRIARRRLPTVRVTARWGYAETCPPAIREACIVQTARWFKRAESAWADTIAKSEFVQLQYSKGLDDAARQMLDGFVRPVV